jgi:hypothetical protein
MQMTAMDILSRQYVLPYEAANLPALQNGGTENQGSGYIQSECVVD